MSCTASTPVKISLEYCAEVGDSLLDNLLFAIQQYWMAEARMTEKFIVFVISLGIAASLAAKPSAIPEIPILSPPFTERLEPDILSAGGLIAGVVSGNLKLPIPENTITVGGISNADNFICVAIKHVDGAYTAGFSVPNPRRGSMVRFRIPARLVGRLKAKIGTLAILAQTGRSKDCESDSALLPATWGRGPVSTRAYALINNHQADLTLARVGSSAVQRCLPINDAAGADMALRSFQVACPITLAGSCKPDPELVVQFVDSGQDSEIRRRVRRLC